MQKPSSPSSAALKALFEARLAALRARQDLARGQGRARVRFAYGLACDVEHEQRSMRVDAAPEDGGGATGPDPGQLVRASLGASLLQGYRLWAARLGVAIDDASLEISCEYDARAQLELDASARPAWSLLRVSVTIYSDAPESELGRVIDAAHRKDPVLALLSPAIPCELHVELRRS